MSEKPGVMIYFEIMEAVNRMSDEQAGALLKAILSYGSTMREPEIRDDLFMLWPLIRARLDSDDERYYRTSQRKRYAVYSRWAKNRNEEILPFEQWVMEYGRAMEEEMIYS